MLDSGALRNGTGEATGFDFVSNCGAAVGEFSITSSSPIFDEGDNSGFPLQIFFEGRTGSFEMTRSARRVPRREPGSLLLIAAGLAAFVWRRTR